MTHPTAKVLPNQPNVQVPVRIATTSNKPATKPSYTGARPLTNLQVVSFGEPTRDRASPTVSHPQPPIKSSIQERPRKEPPRHDPSRQKALPQEAQDEKAAQAKDDRLYSVPPQPRPFVYHPPNKKTYSTIRSNANTILSSQALASTYTAPVEAEHDYPQPHRQAKPTVTSNDSVDAKTGIVLKRAPTVIKPPGVFSSHVFIYTSLTAYPQLNPNLQTTVLAPDLTQLLSK